MKGFSLFLSVLAVLAAAASAALFFLVGNQKGDLSQELTAARADLSRAQQRYIEVVAERDALVKKTAEREAEMSRLYERNTALEPRNAQLTREVAQLRDQVNQRERTEHGTSSQVNELRRQLEEAKNAAASSVGGATAEQVTAYEARITELEAQVAVLRASTPAPSSDQLARVPVELNGNVIEVGPQAAFVVLNIGTRNGAIPSLEMVVRHGSTIVARVRLTDVRDSYSVAHVLPKTGTGTIRTGDIASRS